MTRRATWAWLALGALAFAAGCWLRFQQIGAQIVIDDEWHALHKVLRSDLLGIVTHLDYADYSIPLTVYFRALYDTVGITEWGMHLPMLAAGLALVAAGPWLVRDWTAPAVRATWTVLLALSPLLVYVSRTARPYAIIALTTTVALVAFERWWRGQGRSRGWATAYVVATFIGGYLHMICLAFTLLPFVYFGAVARADRAALVRLVRLGLVTAVPLAIALLPPLINDWFMFTAKAGVDSVTADSAWRTLLVLAGTAHAAIALAFLLCAAVGIARWWKRDRLLAGYVLVVTGGGALAIVAARPNWVQYPIVFARYLVPVLPLMLLLAAEGLVTLTPMRSRVLHAACIALVAAAWWAAGPLPAQLAAPNQFTGHLRYQFEYDDARNPYVTLRPDEPVPAFYRELARAPAGSLTLIEAPWRLESHFNPLAWYQQVHRQNVKIGLTTPLCGVRDFGEYPESAQGIRLANFVHLQSVLRREATGADFLVMHLRPWSTPPGQDVPWPDVAGCLPAIEQALGAPVYRDDAIVVFALKP
ncbi:MAG TPA: hypothetical protein VMN56_11065 [Casimicrobiaceae bacterium]|nr:hypothetical protein [Casimicrobiaceae bacterium]